ncbi:sodium-dependent transporter [Lentisphaerota bacterium WC36G]|nr:sodium-dependent transporter [Lentisphaerae bacterium WC36]
MEKREHWNNSLGFILAAAGSAVGLGNIWRFPYMVGMNGGAGFVLIYVACLFLIGFPILLTEMVIGRAAQTDQVGAFRHLQKQDKQMYHFLADYLLIGALIFFLLGKIGIAIILLIIGSLTYFYGLAVLGIVGLFTAFCIISFYGVIGGWTMLYSAGYVGDIVNAWNFSLKNQELASSVSNQLVGLSSSADVTATKDLLTFSLKSSVIMQFIFIFSCGAVLALGVRRGIEMFSKILMPILIVMLMILAIRGLTLEGASEGVKFLFNPDLKSITPNTILDAMGHAFFTLSLGCGTIITYGSYLKKDANLIKCGSWILLLDTAIALLAGLAIFPALFAMGLKPEAGPELVFKVLPQLFSRMPLQGTFWAALFFIALFFAALTSGISILEALVAFLKDELKIPRYIAVIICCTAVSLVGAVTALSYANWDNVPQIKQIFTFAFGNEESLPASFFLLLDGLTSKWLLPLGGVLSCVFIVYFWNPKKAIKEISLGCEWFDKFDLKSIFKSKNQDNSDDKKIITIGHLWIFFIRFVAPVVIFVIFLKELNIIHFK